MVINEQVNCIRSDLIGNDVHDLRWIPKFDLSKIGLILILQNVPSFAAVILQCENPLHL